MLAPSNLPQFIAGSLFSHILGVSAVNKARIVPRIETGIDSLLEYDERLVNNAGRLKN